MKVLDTTFLVDLLRGDPKTKIVLSKNEVFLTTQINMYEVLTGLFFKKLSSSKILQAQELFENIRVLPLDDAAVIKSAEICANLLQRGEIIDDCDCLVSGIMLSKNVNHIITKNVGHFRRVRGLVVETYSERLK